MGNGRGGEPRSGPVPSLVGLVVFGRPFYDEKLISMQS